MSKARIGVTGAKAEGYPSVVGKRSKERAPGAQSLPGSADPVTPIRAGRAALKDQQS